MAALAIMLFSGGGCRGEKVLPGGPAQVVDRVLGALQKGDCETIFRAMPPDGVPPRARFLDDCRGAMFEDPRSAGKKQDLSSYRFETSVAELKDDKADVVVRPVGLSARWDSTFRLEFQEGGWRVLGLFDPGREEKRTASPFEAPDPGAGAEGLYGEMVEIPGGSAVIGCPDGKVSNACLERRTVEVEPFEIDRYEVTGADYQKCVAVGACERGMYVTADQRKNCNYGPVGRSQYPMNCISYWGAVQFCEWAGKRLPTEIEWEVAARGIDGRAYPWGSETPDCSLAVIKGCEPAGTNEVGTLPTGATPRGVHDMVGNVEEWTLAAGRMESIIRGGAFDSPSGRATAYRRRGLGFPFRLDAIGFRCAR